MREVCFLINQDGAIFWSDVSKSPSAIPDSRRRWQAIWKHREELYEITHSHPAGPLAFSHEDETTMEAIVTALGRWPRFSVVSPDGIILRDSEGTRTLDEEPWWAALLRSASGMKEK